MESSLLKHSSNSSKHILAGDLIGWTRPANTSTHSVNGSISLHIRTLKYWIRSARASGHSINEIDQAAQSSTKI